MTLEAYYVLTVLTVAVVFFSFEWIAVEVVAVVVLVLLVAAGILSPQEGFSGFGSEAVIAIGSLLVIGAGLVRSGAVRWMADRLGVLAGTGYKRLLLVSTAIPGIVSGFINIIASISIFIPAVLRLARRHKIGPAGLLLPMALSGLLGANLTLIGAGHNLVVNDLLQEQTRESFGFFEFAPIGGILLSGIILYAQLFSGTLHSRNNDRPSDPRSTLHELIAIYELNDRLWECQVAPDSTACCRSLADIAPGRKYGLSVLMVLRKGSQMAAESRDLIIQADDVLALSGRRDQVEALIRDNPGLVLMGQLDAEADFAWSAFDLVEVSVPPRSHLIGKSLRDKGLRRNHGLIAISVWRDRPYRSAVNDRRLQAGDGILLFGSRSHVLAFKAEPDLLWLNEARKQEAPLHLRKFAPYAALIFLVVIASAALNLMSIAVAALAGAAAMVILGIVPPKEAYRHIDWRTVVLVGAMYPVGTALQKTGAAAAMAELVLRSAGQWGFVPALAAVGLLAMLITQPLHNAVAALIMTPVALQVAGSLGANPNAFAMAVVVGASASFLMPVGHPAPMMVQQPGGYRNSDYLKFGIGAALFVLVVIAGVIPVFWPFNA
jgi:di/tricarboxylate transporter